MINDHEFVNKIDIVKSIASGMVDNTVYYINPTVRTFEKIEFNYVKEFEKMQSLFMESNKGKGFPVVETKSGEFKNLKGQSKEFLVLTNKDNQTVNDDVMDKRFKHLGFSTASKAMLNSVIVNITVPGDNTRKVGDLIELNFPEYGGTDDILGEVDAFISGKYLVTAVRHLYNTTTGYSCVLRCMKNCFEHDINEVSADHRSQRTPKSTKNTPSTTTPTTSTGTGTTTGGTTPSR